MWPSVGWLLAEMEVKEICWPRVLHQRRGKRNVRLSPEATHDPVRCTGMVATPPAGVVSGECIKGTSPALTTSLTIDPSIIEHSHGAA